jgi:hypothetical protein
VPERLAFDYAVIRVVPHVEREEFLNVGVIVFCAVRRFLRCRLELDADLLRVIAPTADVEAVAAHLEGMRRICAGDKAAGPIAALSASERFHWLTAPRSAVIQASPVHPGLSEDPEATLDRLFDQLVAR